MSPCHNDRAGRSSAWAVIADQRSPCSSQRPRWAVLRMGRAAIVAGERNRHNDRAGRSSAWVTPVLVELELASQRPRWAVLRMGVERLCGLLPRVTTTALGGPPHGRRWNTGVLSSSHNDRAGRSSAWGSCHEKAKAKKSQRPRWAVLRMGCGVTAGLIQTSQRPRWAVLRMGRVALVADQPVTTTALGGPPHGLIKT